MIQIDDTLVSLDVIERYFLCDLSKCKGECCVEGDSGAPLEDSELAKLQKVLPIIWDDLSPKAQEVIHKQGVAYIDEEGDTVTSIVNGKDCVFTCYDADGTCNALLRKHTGKVRRISISLFLAIFTRYVSLSIGISRP